MTKEERDEMMRKNYAMQLEGMGYAPDGMRAPLVSDLVQTYTIKAYEEMENFIFDTIKPYCEDIVEMKISKKLLERALMEYFENHPEERESGDADEP